MDRDTAREDLAFLRTLIDSDHRNQRSFGAAYFAAGLCYGLQMLLHAGQILDLAPASGPVALAIGVGPTVAFLAVLTILLKRQGPTGGGVVSRAFGAAFGAVGLANLVIAAIVGWVAWRQESFTIWLIYPCVVMALQGAAWLVAGILRRRAWPAWVAAGWFATALAMAAAIPNLAWYVGAAGVGFLFFMVTPGAVLMRSERTHA